jgi:hypothetical protein
VIEGLIILFETIRYDIENDSGSALNSNYLINLSLIRNIFFGASHQVE